MRPTKAVAVLLLLLAPSLALAQSSRPRARMFTDTSHLACGPGEDGKLQLFAGSAVAEYCDASGTPTQRYLAIGNSAGVANSCTQLATDPADCSANQAAVGVNASGVAQGCFDPLLSPGAVTTNRLVKFSGTGGKATAQSACAESGGAITGCSLTGNADTATALAANGANCGSATQAANGVSAAGVAEGCFTPAWTIAGSSGTPQTVSQAETATIAAGAGLSTTASATRTVTVNLTEARVDKTAGVDCTGATDSTTGVQNALNAVPAGRSLVVPSGCRLGLASPGAGGTSLTVPTGVSIICEDESAGFFAVGQRCVGGTYPGAACTTSAECLGGGTCTHDFNGSTLYAPTGGSTYTMLRDEAVSTGVTIKNCTFWESQADPYQRCVGGTNAGKPCRQECDNSATFPGMRCNVDADCSPGTCLRKDDCMGTAGGTSCNGAPLSAVGAGKINVLDFTRTVGLTLDNVRIRDHFVGDFGIKLGNGSLVDVDQAAEYNNCTTPLSGQPTASVCQSFVPCCYGAANAGTSNTQPTTAVTDGVRSVLTGTSATRVKGRGTTSAITLAGSGSRIESSAAVPLSSHGPGTAGNGFGIGVDGSIVDSFLTFVASSGTGLILSAGCTASDNHLDGTSYTGISIVGENAKARANVIKGSPTTGIAVTGTGDKANVGANTITGCTGSCNGIAVASGGDHVTIKGNYVEGNSSGAGIITAALKPKIGGNQVNSVAVDTFDYGIVLDDGSSGANVTGNVLTRLQLAAIRVLGVDGAVIANNSSVLANAAPTASLAPVHLLNDDNGTAIQYGLNHLYYGWRGVVGAGRTDQLSNIEIIGNRFVGLAGAPLAQGGAGILFKDNYVNQGAAFNGGPTLYCDASCSNRGTLCFQDSDCTSCDAAVFKCVPEPLTAFIGSPTQVIGSEHNDLSGNVMFDGRAESTKQCTVAGNIGQRCTVAAANGTCAGGATCSGGPPATCQSGADAGKLCCQTGAGATCAIRSHAAHVKLLDFDTAISHNQLRIVGNDIFSPAAGRASVVAIDMDSVATPGGVMTVADANITNNTVNLEDAANTIGVRFPSLPGTIEDLLVADNNIVKTAQDLVNGKGLYGKISFPPCEVAMASDQATITSTSFIDITALRCAIEANRIYKVYCHMNYTSTATTEGIGFAINGPASPTRVSGRVNMCDSSANCEVLGASNYREVHVNAYNDATALVTANAGTSTNVHGGVLEFIVVNGSTAGTLAARVRAETGSGQSVTVKAGSYCTVQQVMAGS